MPFRFHQLGFDHPDLAGDGATLRARLARLSRVDAPRYERLWSYYRNPMTPPAADDGDGDGRPYRQSQEWGLPTRILGDGGEKLRKEVVIENDIAWRIDAQIDFLFGRPIVLNSAAADPERRRRIERVLRRVMALNGGLGFLQKLALLGAVYGHVDVLVKYAPGSAECACSSACDVQQFGEPPGTADCDDADRDAPRGVRFEIVEPSRGLPLLSQRDPTLALAYVQSYRRTDAVAAEPSQTWTDALLAALRRERSPRSKRRDAEVLEIIAPARWQRYEDERLVADGANSLGRVPLVHVQNVALPFEYAGAGDVEPLVPLQDELNTRMSDRAYRITMQSMKMYLGVGIEDFLARPVGPNKMWTSDDANASITEFGGDSACPSEDAHVEQVREALDKTSGISPVAAGAIRGRIGSLTSAAALKVTLTAMLNRTQRKRVTYGAAIAQLCELSLAWLDRAGVFATTPEERAVELHWPSPLPLGEIDDLDAARAKQALGVNDDEVTRELGY